MTCLLSRSSHLILGERAAGQLRLFLCDADYSILDEVTVPDDENAAELTSKAFISQMRWWRESYGTLSGLVFGVSGAGTDYVTCPLDMSSLGCFLPSYSMLGHQFLSLPGLRCINPLGASDIMLDEVSQVFGALATNPELSVGRHLLCLPGLTTKWVLVLDGQIETFLTSIAGELIVLPGVTAAAPQLDAGLLYDPKAFETGLLRATRLNPTSMLHLVFEARSKLQLGAADQHEALSYLAGLVTVRDIMGSASIFGETESVSIIGTSPLSAAYEAAYTLLGMEPQKICASDLSLRGMVYAHRCVTENIASDMIKISA